MPSDLLPARVDAVVRRILIVDDSRRFRELAAELLAAQGFEVFEDVADGEQALAAVVGECPDGILLDINLPGLDGFTVASSMAASCPGAIEAGMNRASVAATIVAQVRIKIIRRTSRIEGGRAAADDRMRALE